MEKRSDSAVSDMNAFGILGVVFGVLALALSVTIIYGFLFGILSIIFAIVQYRRKKNAFATWSLVLSILAILLSLLILISAISLIADVRETINACIQNPSLPGCEEIIKTYATDLPGGAFR